MTKILAAASIGFTLALTSLPAFAQAYGQPGWDGWQAQATATRTLASGPRRHRKTYYGVGFGQHRRTTATGGNAGGYSDRN